MTPVCTASSINYKTTPALSLSQLRLLPAWIDQRVTGTPVARAAAADAEP
jgi:hypothetical protein